MHLICPGLGLGIRESLARVAGRLQMRMVQQGATAKCKVFGNWRGEVEAGRQARSCMGTRISPGAA